MILPGFASGFLVGGGCVVPLKEFEHVSTYSLAAGMRTSTNTRCARPGKFSV